ncbi:MAG: hypothetical protein DYG89_24555 [Caldilinea sp. CFX5]|nr:hypothetical protein [Caldilinea sp. CFX5]
MTHLNLYLLGSPRIELDGQAVVLSRRKVLAPLVYLAVTRQPQRRDTLATLFWPESGQEAARASLRRELFTLTSALGDGWIESDRESVRLNPEAALWIDVEQFRHHLAATRRHNHPIDEICAACREPLTAAVAIYTGDFLAGFTLADCPEFDNWQFFQVESLRRDLAGALERLVRLHSSHNEYDAAIAVARRWLLLDSLHEPAHRELIKLYALTGHQGAALRQYQECSRLLEEELGVKPEAETTNLFEAIRTRRWHPPPNPSAPTALSQGRTTAPAPVVATPPPAKSQPLSQASAESPERIPSFFSDLRANPMLSATLEGVPTVGRTQELQSLHTWLAQALAGKRRVVCITGEAGLGKTTLVNRFLAEASSKTAVWIGQGQCLELRGTGEAYMPVLEAIGRLCRAPSGPTLVSLLAQRAPTWLVQLPWLVSAEELTALQQRVLGATRERMLREMVEMLEILTTHHPLILVLEDLHWSDYSTLDLLGYLARRQEPARLMVIGTYRAVDAQLRDHSLHTMMQELRVRGHCVELALPYLTAAMAQEYIDARFPQSTLPAELALLLHQRTNGNPLFMQNVVEAWIGQGALVEQEGQWRLQAELATLHSGAPENLRELIEQQLNQLPAEEQRILEAASVVGMEFAVAAVASTVTFAEEDVEERCLTLARRGHFLRAEGISDWPDGTVSARLSFIHHLYQEVLYNRVPISRRVRLHQQIGLRIERGYSGQEQERAAELAVHFVQGRDFGRAIHYLQLAAQHALQRSAPCEAIEQINRGLELLRNLPNTTEQQQGELALQAALAPALLATNGWMAPAVEQAYLRAQALCQQLGDVKQLSSILYGLAVLYEFRGEYQKSQRLMEERLHLSHSVQETGPLLQSHMLLACSTFHQGSFAQSVEHAEQGLALYIPEQHLALDAFYGEDLGVACYYWAAQSLWFLGYPAQALEKAQNAVRLAQRLTHSFGLVHAHEQATFVRQYRREVALARTQAELTIKLATEHGFPYRCATATIIWGWTLVMQGEQAAGITLLRQGIAACQATGAKIDQPYFLTLLAEAYGRVGQVTEGLATLDEALALVQSSRAFFYEAEIHRMRGVLLLLPGAQQRIAEAEVALRQALDIACRQRAKSLELRIAMSLSQLWQQQGKGEEAIRRLAEIYGWFTEGFDTPDLQQAQALLPFTID